MDMNKILGEFQVGLSVALVLIAWIIRISFWESKIAKTIVIGTAFFAFGLLIIGISNLLIWFMNDRYPPYHTKK